MIDIMRGVVAVFVVADAVLIFTVMVVTDILTDLGFVGHSFFPLIEL